MLVILSVVMMSSLHAPQATHMHHHRHPLEPDDIEASTAQMHLDLGRSDCHPERQLARTQRGAWRKFVSYEMFYHLEHHLFPAVPTPRLPEWAARLDKVMPQVARKQVF
jgi:fatty acid desaturase